jgi:hypothetical protein
MYTRNCFDMTHARSALAPTARAAFVGKLDRIPICTTYLSDRSPSNETSLAALVFALLAISCGSPPTPTYIATFDAWCRTSGMPAGSVRVDRDGVAASLVAAWDEIILENSADLFDGDLDDPTLRDFHAERMIGAFASGDSVNFMLLAALPPEINLSAQNRTESLARSFEDRLLSVRRGGGRRG